MTGSPSNVEDRETLLAQVLEDALARARQGDARVCEDVARQHPELAEDFRALFALASLADDFGSEVMTLSETLGSAQTSSPQPDPGPAVALGTVIGAYETIEELGRGGMGVVYRARQRNLGRTVALKMILRGDLASSSDIARFRTEAEAAARLNHPNIVPVYEVGESEGRPYFSMQLIEGTTLAQRLADGPLNSREAAEILLPIARAVAEAHRHGVLHRDLKPSNILIDRAGRPWVSDFGLAKRTDHDSEGVASLTNSGAILGTPGYMAPEQAGGRRGDVGPGTDVYSLGALLYASLTGRPPFQAATALDTVFLVLEQDPVPPRILQPRIDADLEMIALKCLQKPIDLRYASADALADDLQAWLANEPIAARSSHFSQIVTRAFRETHHAGVLENWGLLWILHSLVVLLLCVVTNIMHLEGIESRWPYAALWSVGVGAWAMVFWELRRRSGPITFVERQIAHIWAGSSVASALLFALEAILALPVLTLSPVLALIAGSTFLAKAGILSGKFYVQAACLYLTSFAMAMLQAWSPYDFGQTLFGVVLGGSFFLPGLKYYRQRQSTRERNSPTSASRKVAQEPAGPAHDLSSERETVMSPGS